MIELELPYPPSVNHYWRRVGARMLIRRGGRAFRAAVCAILAARGVRPIAGPLELVIDVFPPTSGGATWTTCKKPFSMRWPTAARTTTTRRSPV